MRRKKGIERYDALIASYVGIISSDPCAYCGGPMSVVDHIEPLSASGLHQWDNLTPACGKCNARKSARPLLEFLAGRRC